MESPPKETRKETRASRRRRPSGERLKRYAPLVISKMPLQKPRRVSGERGRKNSRRESREKKFVCSMALDNAPKRIRYPPMRRTVFTASETEAERASVMEETETEEG